MTTMQSSPLPSTFIPGPAKIGWPDPAKTGWSIALRGVLAVVFGIIALASPRIAAGAFVIVFAIYALVDGAVALSTAARRGRAGLHWGWFLFEGLVSLAIGVLALVYPGMTLLLLVLFVAIRALVLGILEIGGAIGWKGIESRWLLGITGVVSLLFGLVLLWNPLAGGLALIWVIGIYAIVFGAMLIALGLHVHGLDRHLHGGAAHAATGN
jgi:uncharacterized membrane protein HdeD (DUF308 family)